MINAPPEKVFAFTTDWERLPEWNVVIKEVKPTSEKRKGVGVTFHQVLEVGGTRAESDVEVTEWVENQRIAVRTTSGNLTMLGLNTVKAVKGGTELTIAADYELPYSILGKIIDKLKVSKDVDKGIASALQNLKNLLEKK